AYLRADIISAFHDDRPILSRALFDRPRAWRVLDGEHACVGRYDPRHSPVQSGVDSDALFSDERRRRRRILLACTHLYFACEHVLCAWRRGGRGRWVDALQLEELLVGGNYHPAACVFCGARLCIASSQHWNHAQEANDLRSDSHRRRVDRERRSEPLADSALWRAGSDYRDRRFLFRILCVAILGF